MQWAESQLAELKSHLEGLLEDRRSTLQANIDALHERVGRLEAQFEADRASTMAEVEARNKELTDKLEAFQVICSLVLPHSPRALLIPPPPRIVQAAFDAEKKDRLEREARIQANLSKHEHETFQQFELERVRANVEVCCVFPRSSVSCRTRGSGRTKPSRTAWMPRSLLVPRRTRSSSHSSLLSWLTSRTASGKRKRFVVKVF